MKYKIVVIDDDQSIVKMLTQGLEAQGYMVESAPDGKEGIRLITREKPDVVILDWSLPDITGLQVCQFLRSNKSTAQTRVLMLTVLGEMKQKVSAFEVGADDYLTKPFDFQELSVRVKALLRRGGIDQTPVEVLEVDQILVDVSSHKVTVKGAPILLRPKEFELLHILLKSQGKVLSRQFLIERVWGYNSKLVTTRTIDSHMARLREKLGKAAGNMIQTIPGFGYKLERDADANRRKSKS